MGDRTDCTLELGGKTTAELWAAIEEQVRALHGTPSDRGIWANIEFEGVNYGEMPDGLQKAIENAGLSYVWRYAPGGCYDGGTQWRIAEGQAVVGNGLLHEGEDVIPISLLADKIRAAKHYICREEAFRQIAQLVTQHTPPALPKLVIEAAQQPTEARGIGAVLFNCWHREEQPDWSDYCGLEIGGCRLRGDTVEGFHDADTAEFFTVYGRNRENLAEAITDCPTLDHARRVCALLAHMSGLPVHTYL